MSTKRSALHLGERTRVRTRIYLCDNEDYDKHYCDVQFHVLSLEYTYEIAAIISF